MALLAFASASADASYFINEKDAVSHARDHFHRVGYHYAEAVCSPQFLKAPVRGFDYHRWSCGFAAGDDLYAKPTCTGSILISGSGEPGHYYYRVNYHDGFCPWGA